MKRYPRRIQPGQSTSVAAISIRCLTTPQGLARLPRVHVLGRVTRSCAFRCGRQVPAAHGLNGPTQRRELRVSAPRHPGHGVLARTQLRRNVHLGELAGPAQLTWRRVIGDGPIPAPGPGGRQSAVPATRRSRERLLQRRQRRVHLFRGVVVGESDANHARRLVDPEVPDGLQGVVVA